MSIDNKTNQGRVKKIVETIELLTVSANSNKATDDEIKELMAPALEAISAFCGLEAPAAPTSSPAPDQETPETPAQSSLAKNAPQWAHVREMAEKADLKDLTVAMAVLMNRLEDAL